MSKSKNLTVWIPTGYIEGGCLRAFVRMLFAPVFLSAVAGISTTCMFYFSAWRLWVLPTASAGLTVLIITFRWRAKKRRIISRRKAEKSNTFLYVASYLEQRYQNHISLTAVRTGEDKTLSTAVYRQLLGAVMSLGLYIETGLNKTKKFSGVEFIRVKPIEFYVDFILGAGTGYVLFYPTTRLISKIASVDERVISRTLRDVGLIDWRVERVNYDDDLVLFILRDETVSRAYNLVGDDSGTMYEKLARIAETTPNYEIPLMPNHPPWNIRSAPNALISASVGKGKSYLSLYLLTMSSLKGHCLYLADPKKSDMAALAPYMPEGRVAKTEADICSMAAEVVGVMNDRYAYMEGERSRRGLFQADFADFGLCAVVLIIEELAAHVSSLDKKSREEFETNIKQIILKGRQAGVNIVTILQSPNTENIKTEIRSQMGLRVYLGNSGGIEWRMVFGEGHTYQKRLYRAGQGLYMLDGVTVQPEMFYAPRLDEKGLSYTLKRALARQADIDPLAPTPPCRHSEAEAERVALLEDLL
jgi:hypothetical protein